MTPLQEDETIQSLGGRIIGRYARREQETAQIEIAPDKDEQIAPNGTISLKALSPVHVLIVADAIATSVILAHDEKNVSAVFDVIEPLARELAEHGRTPGGRRTILKHIGNALLVQHRVSGLVAVAEKPDVLWERPDLERFYARLEDEYELKERADLLTRKLTVISNTGQALADIIDTERSLRLERIIIALILVETIFTGYQIFFHERSHGVPDVEMAEGVGFEPTREQSPLPVFKTGALNHSATLPSSMVANSGKALIAHP